MKFANPKFPRLISVQYKEHVLEVGKLLLVTNTGVDRWSDNQFIVLISNSCKQKYKTKIDIQRRLTTYGRIFRVKNDLYGCCGNHLGSNDRPYQFDPFYTRMPIKVNDDFKFI